MFTAVLNHIICGQWTGPSSEKSCFGCLKTLRREGSSLYPEDGVEPQMRHCHVSGAYGTANVSKKFCGDLTVHGHTLAAFQCMPIFETGTVAEDTDTALRQSEDPLSAVMPLSDELPSLSSRVARHMVLKVLYGNVHKVLESLYSNAVRGCKDSISGKL